MEPDKNPEHAGNGSGEEPPHTGQKPGGVGNVVLRFIGGAIVLLFVVIALVFGVCLLG